MSDDKEFDEAMELRRQEWLADRLASCNLYLARRKRMRTDALVLVAVGLIGLTILVVCAASLPWFIGLALLLSTNVGLAISNEFAFRSLRRRQMFLLAQLQPSGT